MNLDNIKRRNDVSRFITLLPDESIQKLEDFFIAEDLQVDETKPVNEDHTADIKELLSGSEGLLTEDTVQKISVLFEACVNRKVNTDLRNTVVSLTEQVEGFIQESQDKVDDYANYVKTELESENREYINNLNEKIGDYLDYVANEWIEDNRLAIHKGVENQISENIIQGLKNLFTENYINVPTQKINLIGELEQKVANLLESNVRLTNELREKSAKISDLLKESRFNEITKSLTDLEKDKLRNLSKGLKVSSLKDYESKLEILKESVVNTKVKDHSTGILLSEDTVFANAPKQSVDIDPRIQEYLKVASNRN